MIALFDVGVNVASCLSGAEVEVGSSATGVGTKEAYVVTKDPASVS
jgi:hypothetical protein